MSDARKFPEIIAIVNELRHVSLARLTVQDMYDLSATRLDEFQLQALEQLRDRIRTST